MARAIRFGAARHRTPCRAGAAACLALAGREPRRPRLVPRQWRKPTYEICARYGRAPNRGPPQWCPDYAIAGRVPPTSRRLHARAYLPYPRAVVSTGRLLGCGVTDARRLEQAPDPTVEPSAVLRRFGCGPDDHVCDIVGDVHVPRSATPTQRVPAALTTHGFGEAKDAGPLEPRTGTEGCASRRPRPPRSRPRSRPTRRHGRRFLR